MDQKAVSDLKTHEVDDDEKIESAQLKVEEKKTNLKTEVEKEVVVVEPQLTIEKPPIESDEEEEGTIDYKI